MKRLAFVSARKPPVALILHPQGYQQQNSTANTTDQQVQTHLPVQNIHVQTVQAQNIHFQNVHMQPPSPDYEQTASPEPNIQYDDSGYTTSTITYAPIQTPNACPPAQPKLEYIETRDEQRPINVKTESNIFLAPVSTFQLVTTIETTTSSNHVTSYAHSKPQSNQTSVIVSPEMTTVIVTQPMIISLESTSESTFGGYVPLVYSTCVTHKDSSDAKQARTPLVASQHTHSPQLPAPSPNYPIQSQIVTPEVDKDTRNIPNRNVPILNNNYISNNASTQQSDASQMKISEAKQQAIQNKKYKETTTNDKPKKRPVEKFVIISNEIIAHAKTDINNTVNNDYSNNKLENNTDNNFINNNKQPDIMLNTSINSNDVPFTQSSQQLFTVLNVPIVSKLRLALEERKPAVSKLDLMTARRRIRRFRRLKNKPKTKPLDETDSSVYSSSDSDSDDGLPKVDLWIKSGPPLKPDYRPNKLRFLKIFGLTTHYNKNGKFPVNL